jgi:hypothetical protein
MRSQRRRCVDTRGEAHRHTECLISPQPTELRRQPLRFQPEVDESCSSDFGRLTQVRDVELVDDLLCNLARISTLLLRQDHRRIGLVITKAWIVYLLDLGVGGIGPAGECLAEPLFKNGGDGIHAETRAVLLDSPG